MDCFFYFQSIGGIFDEKKFTNWWLCPCIY
uniref:Ferredoxin thioredoxin reductase catalytic beta chain n=1 Tax=Siphoviridae sp. ctfW121 TaxID=2826413 RepID=A0A8S5N922_9CAUD|nr:MAG TPA: Ferredoxin thioredoxin reductase catalytic beta chain [Siphoviridae sp. ctfW121]